MDVSSIVFLLLAFTLGETKVCRSPQFSFYGTRKEGFVYDCVQKLGGHPGVTVPCSLMCPFNITLNFRAEANTLIHLTGANGQKPDPDHQYSIVVTKSNCTQAELSVVWTGPAFTIVAGRPNKTVAQQTHCPSTPNPMYCSCSALSSSTLSD